jgi:ABC-type uncharacterized transport system substrate-binding protein
MLLSRHTRRRDFITLLGGAAVAWPLTPHAQQPVMPVIGFLDTRSPDTIGGRLNAFRQGLKEIGYAEGENVTIVYRWAEGRYDRLPELATDLVRRQVTLIVASGGLAPAFAAKTATTTIPIVFVIPENPVSIGLVASLARPGGNLTGVNILVGELAAKRLELLRELVPAAARMAVLVNPSNAASTTATLRDVETAARAMALQIQVVHASTNREIDSTFATLAREQPDALFVGSDSFFPGRRVQLSNLTVRHTIPAAFSQRDYTDVGGLMSYGSKIADAYRQAGAYAGRILKGEKAGDLPVEQATKFELVINLGTATALGIAVPNAMQLLADEVIE